MNWPRILLPLFLGFLTAAPMPAKASVPAKEPLCTDDAEEVVTAAYRNYLFRDPDPEGLGVYSAYLRRTNSVRMVMIVIAKSDEWRQKHGAGNVDDEVEALFHMFLNRPSDPDGKKRYTGVLLFPNGMANLLDDPNGFAWSKEANAQGQRLPGVGVSWCTQTPPHPIAATPALPQPAVLPPTDYGACYSTSPSGGMPAQRLGITTKAQCGKNNWFRGMASSRGPH